MIEEGDGANAEVTREETCIIDLLVAGARVASEREAVAEPWITRSADPDVERKGRLKRGFWQQLASRPQAATRP